MCHGGSVLYIDRRTDTLERLRQFAGMPDLGEQDQRGRVGEVHGLELYLCRILMSSNGGRALDDEHSITAA